MTDDRRHDAWRAGDAYERYMGRWSRRVAPAFLDWLAPAPGLRWLEVGCGTGALSAAVFGQCAPRWLAGVDPSAAFLATARAALRDPRAMFLAGSGDALAVADGAADAAVSGLAINFIPDGPAALRAMRRATRPGGRLGFYVWDYPGRGVGFMAAFWRAAVALDPTAAGLAEDRRFPGCTRDALAGMARGSGWQAVEAAGIEVPTVFTGFDDLWEPFTLGAGPAPGYCAALPPARREALRERLRQSLPTGPDGTITLGARAWAVRGVA